MALIINADSPSTSSRKMESKYYQKDGVEFEEDEFDTYVDKDTGQNAIN